MKWDSGSVFLTAPSLCQCQEVISELKNNIYNWVTLRNSSPRIVLFLLPQLLKIRKITWINIVSTKITKNDIISSQLSNNATLRKLWITFGSINDDGVITLAQSLEYNRSVIDLYFNSNPDITSASAQSLAQLLLRNYTLKGLNLWDTNIDTNGVLVLVESLRINRRLERLYLDKQHKKTCNSLPYYKTIKDRLRFE